MKSTLIIIGVLLLLLLGYVTLNEFVDQEMEGEPDGETPSVVTDLPKLPNMEDGDSISVSALELYFADQMFARGTADGLIPIEGFDAGLLMGKFDGLVAMDFEGVRAFEGVYSVENDVPVFERTSDGPVSSAAQTVSRAGYATLLQNISTRLSQSVNNEGNVDTLIDLIGGAVLPESDEDAIGFIECDDEQYNVDACIEIYQPVCGKVRVECITTPCDPVLETFSNACYACQNDRVSGYVEGECEA